MTSPQSKECHNTNVSHDMGTKTVPPIPCQSGQPSHIAISLSTGTHRKLLKVPAAVPRRRMPEKLTTVIYHSLKLVAPPWCPPSSEHTLRGIARLTVGPGSLMVYPALKWPKKAPNCHFLSKLHSFTPVFILTQRWPNYVTTRIANPWRRADHSIT